MDEIKGWNSYQKLYREFVDQAQSGCQWVEVGVFLGKGLIDAAVYAKFHKKDITFWAVDNWLGSDTENEHKEFINSIGGPDRFYEAFLYNTKKYGVQDIIKPLRMDADVAATNFPDHSLDIVYLDAAHTYNAVCTNIQSWLPKVKIDGILSGHDINCSEVKKAVLDTLGRYDGDKYDSWIYNNTKVNTKND